VHKDFDLADRRDQPLSVASRRSEAMTVQGGVEGSRRTVTNKLNIRRINAPYPLTSGSARQEPTKAFYIGKLGHRWFCSKGSPYGERSLTVSVARFRR
jgi:hypothetical protein